MGGGSGPRLAATLPAPGRHVGAGGARLCRGGAGSAGITRRRGRTATLHRVRDGLQRCARRGRQLLRFALRPLGRRANLWATGNQPFPKMAGCPSRCPGGPSADAPPPPPPPPRVARPLPPAARAAPHPLLKISHSPPTSP